MEKAKARASAPSPPSVRSYASRADVERRAAAVVREKEVSLAEELEKARERRGRLRAARQVTERVLAEADEALRREMREWEHRADEQRRVVAKLMRLIGMPEVFVPVESLRSREERKRKQGTASSDPPREEERRLMAAALMAGALRRGRAGAGGAAERTLRRLAENTQIDAQKAGIRCKEKSSMRRPKGEEMPVIPDQAMEFLSRTWNPSSSDIFQILTPSCLGASAQDHHGEGETKEDEEGGKELDAVRIIDGGQNQLFNQIQTWRVLASGNPSSKQRKAKLNQPMWGYLIDLASSSDES